ncbi:hypothetical protein ACFQX7_00345 [Luedemannella flava]
MTGAAWSQKGNTVTFTPEDPTAVVPPHGSVQFTAVTSKTPKEPKGCTINDRACS